MAGGVPFVHPTCFSRGYFDSAKLLTISAEDSDRLRSTEFKSPALIFTRVGEPECCVVPANLGRFNIHGDVIGVETASGSDPFFISAFYESRTGLIELRRYQAGSTRPRTNTDSLAETLVLQPDLRVQTYIGDMVRRAEQLRERARLLEAEVDACHAKRIPTQEGLHFAKRTRRVSIALLTERMDAHFYPGVVEQYKARQAFGWTTLRSLCISVRTGITLPDTVGETSVRQATVANLSRNFLYGQYRRVDRPRKLDGQLGSHDLLFCDAAHTKNYIGKEICYSHKQDGIFPSTEVMVITVDRKKIPASYVRAYLLTKVGYVQLQSTIRGISAHSYPADVARLEIPVPVVSECDRDEWFKTDDLMLAAGTANETATILITAAKHLVEALIDGKVTEADFVQAQEALERHDRGSDRALLARLTAQGMDVAGAKPLFPDLDKLYELLDQNDGEDE
ncbi:MAG: restriction endonuclease subunit S [bacterium]